MLEIGGLHLLSEQFLIDQAVKDGTAVIVSKLAERAAVEQGFIAQGLIPIALQNDVTVHSGDNTVDDFRLGCGNGNNPCQ
jgi:hypothetical protein